MNGPGLAQLVIKVRIYNVLLALGDELEEQVQLAPGSLKPRQRGLACLRIKAGRCSLESGRVALPVVQTELTRCAILLGVNRGAIAPLLVVSWCTQNEKYFPFCMKSH